MFHEYAERSNRRKKNSHVLERTLQSIKAKQKVLWQGAWRLSRCPLTSLMTNGIISKNRSMALEKVTDSLHDSLPPPSSVLNSFPSLLFSSFPVRPLELFYQLFLNRHIESGEHTAVSLCEKWWHAS